MIRSFKLRYRDRHVRIVPKRDLAGRPFAGPGVDVHGAEAARVFELAAPMEAWLRAREPGLKLRSLSADLDAGRVLVSFDDPHGVNDKPVALRIVAPDSSALLDAAKPLLEALVALATNALRARASR